MTELTQIPTSIVSGDAYVIDLTLDEYLPTDGWTGNLYMRGVNVLNVGGTTNGQAHRFTLNSSATETLTEGVYEFAVTVTKDGNRTTVLTGVITVNPNLATSGTRISHITKMLNAITSVLENRVTDDVQSLSIAGRSITNIPITELMELRAVYTRELSVLTNGASSVRKTVPIVFNRPF